MKQSIDTNSLRATVGIARAATMARPPVPAEWFDVGFEVFSEVDAVRAAVSAEYHTAEPASVVRSATYELHVLVNADLAADVRATGEIRACTAVESFAGWWYSSWTTEDGFHVLASGVGYAWQHVLVTEDFRSWVLIGDIIPGAAVATARILRELVREHLVQRGALMFHAGGCVLPDGSGIMLPGHSGAGKTTASVQVAATGGRCVATDRLLVLRDLDADKWWMIGLPSTTRLGRGAVQALEINDSSGLARHRDNGPALAPGGKISLTNREVAELVGGGFVSGVRLDRIVVLSADGSDRPLWADPADPLSAVLDHALVPDPAYRTQWLSPGAEVESADSLRDALRELVADVPVHLLRWTPSRHCDRATPTLFVPNEENLT
ncbi:hypothetical protein [Nocardia sp. NPDC052566]|uniref:hypothetical protein n=1 Tax=Nocardia sp. NPDC052566 TaxID=3364330 RepID=UPI0037C7B974